jgi:hypothetical protein
VSTASAAGAAPGTPSFEDPLVPLPPDAPAATSSHGWRRLLEWSGTSAPVAALLLAGIALGPNGIALLSSETLALLAPAVPVAVGALGVLLGLSVAVGKADDGRIVLPACLDAVGALVVVGAGLAVLALAQSGSVTRPLLVLIAGAGACAASSLTLPTGNPLEPRPGAVRIVELGTLVAVLLGGGILAWFESGTVLAAAGAMAAASGLVCAMALAVWLLLTVASTATEERVLAVSALLLVGGLSDALSTSALLGGLVAAMLWRFAGRGPAESIGRDVLFVQHPLLAGLLLTAGASAEVSRQSLAWGAAYVALRVAARLAGSLVAQRVRGGVDTPADLVRHLLPPGVFGVAFAWHAAGVLGPDGAMLLGTVVVGTIGSEVVAYALSSGRNAA